MTTEPLVSIIIPCRNERRFIGQCLASIISSTYPKGSLEVLVIDGMSVDGTRQVVQKFEREVPFIRMIDNKKTTTPCALNIGVGNAAGEIIIRMDAHTEYDPQYISKCVEWLSKSGADNVGGIWITTPSKDTLWGKCISLALSHPFGVGNSYFRVGSKQPKYVDTVPFGCYKREVFSRIGLFKEELLRSQDIEFNVRLRRAGGEILLVPDIKCRYFADSNLKDLAVKSFRNGFWVIYSAGLADMPFSPRHLVPFVFICSLVAGTAGSLFYSPSTFSLALIAGAYVSANAIFSLMIAAREKRPLYFPFIFLSFLALHFSYGLGSASGLAALAKESARRFFRRFQASTE